VTFFLVGKNFREECTMSDARFLQVGVDGVDGLLFGPEAILSFPEGLTAAENSR
jgi:hypothetical protein